MIINEQLFSGRLKSKLGESYGRALVVFRKYNELPGEHEFGELVIKLLLLAVNKVRVNEVLDVIAGHYHRYFYGHDVSKELYPDTYMMFIRLEEGLRLL